MKRPRGFTLLELIMAMAIMVMVGATMAAAIHASFGLKSSAENAVEATRDVSISGDIFVQTLRGVVPPNPNSAQSTSQPSGTIDTTVIPTFFAGAFIGDSGSMQFYATGADPHAEVSGDIRYVEFGVTPQKSGMAFVIRQDANLLRDDPTPMPTEEILVPNVESVKFAYFDGSMWLDTWDSTTNGNLLPYAVSMELAIPSQRRGVDPRIIRRVATITCAAPSTQTSTDGTGL